MRTSGPIVALFPEASFGAALNCVGIAQALARRGATPVFVCHPGFTGIFAEYGFREYHLTAESRPSSDVDTWQAFVERHLPHFDLSPAEQLETYVAPTWEAIVDSALAVDDQLALLLARMQPDLIVLDNVIMFPAIAASGIPWARMVSCAETELPDENVPPYLSGLPAGAAAERDAFEHRYLSAVAPAHEQMNLLRARRALAALPPGIFLENSPWLNLLLTPKIVRHERASPFDPSHFVYLEGCVRTEGPYEVPDFPSPEGPLVYASFGSLGAMDRALIERMLAVFATIPARFLVNAGSLRDAYGTVPDNVHLDGWYPQPSVVSQADLFIHHGGNNSFCEALVHGVPSLVMPYCWDGHDNGRRAEETGVGRHMHRSKWTPEELRSTILTLLDDPAMRERLRENAERAALAPGVEAAADAILRVADDAGHDRAKAISGAARLR